MQRWKIGHGDRAIHKTILHMQALVLGPEGVGHPAVRVAAIDAARGSVKNINEIDAVLAWMKQHIEFRGEHAETLQSPVVTLQLGAGDCDDHSILSAAMLMSLGYKVRFKTVASQRSAPGQFSHVYVIVQDKRTGEWKGLDSTVPESFAGWEPPMVYRSKVYGNSKLGDDGADDLTTNDVVDDLVSPLSQALANRIQYGSNTPFYASTGYAGNSSGAKGLPSWVWLLALGGIAYYVSQK